MNIEIKANKIIKEKLITIEYDTEHFIGYIVANVVIRFCKRSNNFTCFCQFHTLKDTEQEKDCSYTLALKKWRKGNELSTTRNKE